MKTTLSEIKKFPCDDVTDYSNEILIRLAYGRTIVAYSVGTYGVNGIVFLTFDGKLYKITKRSTALFYFL